MGYKSNSKKRKMNVVVGERSRSRSKVKMTTRQKKIRIDNGVPCDPINARIQSEREGNGHGQYDWSGTI